MEGIDEGAVEDLLLLTQRKLARLNQFKADTRNSSMASDYMDNKFVENYLDEILQPKERFGGYNIFGLRKTLHKK